MEQIQFSVDQDLPEQGTCSEYPAGTKLISRNIRDKPNGAKPIFWESRNKLDGTKPISREV
jgi:hypothetical protein